VTVANSQLANQFQAHSLRFFKKQVLVDLALSTYLAMFLIVAKTNNDCQRMMLSTILEYLLLVQLPLLAVSLVALKLCFKDLDKAYKAIAAKYVWLCASMVVVGHSVYNSVNYLERKCEQSHPSTAYLFQMSRIIIVFNFFAITVTAVIFTLGTVILILCAVVVCI